MIAPAYALAIDTTHATLRLGLSNLQNATRMQAWPLGRDLSIQFHQHLSDFIAPQTWEDLAWISVARGPGSYTGTRIGMVTATTLAQQLQIPLFPVSTLAAYAWAFAQTHPISPPVTLAVSLPGQRDQVHGGIYQISHLHCTPCISDRQWAYPDWQHQCAQFPQAQIVATDTQPLPDADLTQALLTLGQQCHAQEQAGSWQQAQPYYP